MNILKPLRLKHSTRARSYSQLSMCVYLQFSLLSEVRGIVTPQDVERFDGLVLRREIEALKARQGGAGFQDSFSMVSYPDTLASSSASFMTNTTLSSARVRGYIHIYNEINFLHTCCKQEHLWAIIIELDPSIISDRKCLRLWFVFVWDEWKALLCVYVCVWLCVCET